MPTPAIGLQISTIVGDHNVRTWSVCDLRAAADWVGKLCGPGGLDDPNAFRWRITGNGLPMFYDILAVLETFAEVEGMVD